MADLNRRVKQAHLNKRILDEHNLNAMDTSNIKIASGSQRKSSTVASESSQDTRHRRSVYSQSRAIQHKSTWRGLTLGLTGLGIIRRRPNLAESEPRKPKPQLENTYRTEPISGTQFLPSEVKRVASIVLEQELQRLSHRPTDCANLSTKLAQVIRDKVKRMNFPRHKLICNVIIGEDKNHGLEVASRCLWNSNTDGLTSVSYKTKDLFVVAIIHAIYFE